ncbi:hypothetical protein K4L04_03910 [Phaeobacter inhibens]|uniref:hypothetical protein n=1 Tax=Phaeobacter inhibens TaxID=221822 RepID=UPI0021A58E8E|nr:hypothetical protein [Phaeobacter inhibens]UWR77114.1 hypothetical protein K4L04_03910 [Phaeobacter inhibens]
MSIEWSQASAEQRKSLYKVAKAVAATTPLTLERFLNKALGISGDPEWGDLANVRNGRLARDKCQALYGYLAEHHYDHAQKQDADLFPQRLIRDVEAFFDKAAHKSRLRVVLADQDLDLVKRRGQKPKADVSVMLGEEFYFELDAASSGFAAAFQGYQGKYYPFPLAENGEDLIGRIKAGKQNIPRSIGGDVDVLSEDENTGMHHFVVLTSTNRNHLVSADVLPDQLDRLEVYAVRVFVGNHQDT